MRRSVLLPALLVLAGCGGPAPEPFLGGHPIVFVRDGVAVAASGPDLRIERVREDGGTEEVEGAPLASGYVLVETRWDPGERVRFRVHTAGVEREWDRVAPAQPSPLPLAAIDLDPILPLPTGPSVEGHVTVCRLAPDGRSVFLATSRGRIAVVELPAGDVRFGLRVCDGMVKQAAWDPDGSAIWVGEQTRDGWLRRLDARTGAERCRFRLADELGEGPSPDSEDGYAWVNQPGPYRMAVLPGGDLLVAGERSGTSDGRARSASRLYRFAPDGAVRWRWPADAPIPLNLPWFDVDREGTRLAFLAAAPLGTTDAAALLPAGSVALLDPGDGSLVAHFAVPPVNGHPVHFWRGVALSPDGAHVAATTQDGREFLFDAPAGAEWRPRKESRLATPIRVSGIPVHVTSGTLAATSREVLLVFGDTYIPYDARRGEERPLSAHPAANTLHAVNWAGEFRWRRPMENFPSAIVLDRDRRYAAVSFSPGASGLGGDRNGVAVFDLSRGGTGLDRVAWEVLTAGAVPYDQIDISLDGSTVVAVEVPYRRPASGSARGAFRLHAWR